MLKYLNLKGCFQYLVTISGALTIVSYGMVRGWTSPFLLQQQQQNSSNFSLTSDEGSWMATLPLLANILACPMGALITDRVGRKKSVLFSTLPFMVSWVIIAFSESVLLLYMARFIAGVASGVVYIALPIYIGEIADPCRRGMLETALAVAGALGILLVNVLGSNLNLMTTALVASSLPLLTLLTLVWMPESPYYHLMKKNTKAARRSLQVLKESEDVDFELDRINVAVYKQTVAKTGTPIELFTEKGSRKALFIVLLVRAIQKLSGIDAVIYYTQSVFYEVNDGRTSDVDVTIFLITQLVSTLISCYVVDRTGRKSLIVLSTAGTGFSLFIVGSYFFLESEAHIDSKYSLVATVSLIAYMIFYNIGLATIPSVLIGELFPMSIKASALCVLDIYYCTLTIVAVKGFQITRDCYGIYIPFYISATCCAVGVLVVVFIMPETKGQTLEDIQLCMKDHRQF